MYHFQKNDLHLMCNVIASNKNGNNLFIIVTIRAKRGWLSFFFLRVIRILYTCYSQVYYKMFLLFHLTEVVNLYVIDFSDVNPSTCLHVIYHRE